MFAFSSVNWTRLFTEGYYLFIETSRPRQPGDTALLSSPVFPATYAGKCFQFWYHMYGRVGGNFAFYSLFRVASSNGLAQCEFSNYYNY